MFTPHLDKSVLYLLAEVFCLSNGLRANEDALAVVRVLRTLRPLAPEFAVAEALQLNHDSGRRVALLVLEEADARCPGNALVKATLALILYGQRDSLWQAYADEVKALPPNDKALAIVASIEKAVRNEPDDPGDTDSSAEAQTPAQFGATYLPYLQMGVPC